MKWTIHHKPETVSTNLDARAGRNGDVFTADFQTAGRGRLDHVWHSEPGENLMMSAVLDVGDCPPEQVATLPLVVGLAVIEGLSPLLGVQRGLSPMLKWPNDVLVEGRKLAGILCERHGDLVIAGLGVNVGQARFPKEIAKKATSLSVLLGFGEDGATRSSPLPERGTDPVGATRSSPLLVSVSDVRDAVLAALGRVYGVWRKGGLSPFLGRLGEVDYLRGRMVSVVQTDDDREPLTGVCEGIAPDGSLIVAGRNVYAGEAHVCAW